MESANQELVVETDFNPRLHLKLLLLPWERLWKGQRKLLIFRLIFGVFLLFFGLYNWFFPSVEVYLVLVTLIAGGYYFGDSINKIDERRKQRNLLKTKANEIVYSGFEGSKITMKFDQTGLHHEDISQTLCYNWSHCVKCEFHEDVFMLIEFKNGQMYIISEEYTGKENYALIKEFVSAKLDLAKEVNTRTGPSKQILDD